MPKESVAVGVEFADTEHGEIDVDDLKPGSNAPIYQRRVITRWTRDGGYVEIGVAKVSVSDLTERDPHYGILTRDDINRLIRTLRKARDQSFGTDA